MTLAADADIMLAMDNDDLLSEAEARAIFEPHFSRLADCLLTGWDAWEAIRATPEGVRLGPSARARIIWDHATAHAENLFDDIPGVAPGRRHGLLILDFGRALLRFKKLDDHLQTRGIETEQQRLFANQDHLHPYHQLTLGWGAPMVVAGYVLDSLGSSIERLVLVLLRRQQVVWSVDIPAIRAARRSAHGMVVPAAATVRSTRRPGTEEASKEAQ